MLKDDSFLLRTFFTKRMTKFVERLNIASCIDNFPFFQKFDQYASPKARLIGDVRVSSLPQREIRDILK
jgi:hypothetical protein